MCGSRRVCHQPRRIDVSPCAKKLWLFSQPGPFSVGGNYSCDQRETYSLSGGTTLIVPETEIDIQETDGTALVIPEWRREPSRSFGRWAERHWRWRTRSRQSRSLQAIKAARCPTCGSGRLSDEGQFTPGAGRAFDIAKARSRGTGPARNFEKVFSDHVVDEMMKTPGSILRLVGEQSKPICGGRSCRKPLLASLSKQGRFRVLGRVSQMLDCLR